MKTYKKTTRRNAGFTLVELLISIFILAVLAIIPTAIILYDGEREVNGQTVDCIGLFTQEPPLPEGYRWDVEWNPIVPSVVLGFPAGLIVNVLTDAKCPVPNEGVLTNIEPVKHPLDAATDQ